MAHWKVFHYGTMTHWKTRWKGDKSCSTISPPRLGFFRPAGFEIPVITGASATSHKKIYTAVTLEEAEENLLQFGEKWRKQYPSCVKSWEENWEVLSTFYEYPPEVRKIIYTTNIIEGLNRQFRQTTKNKPSFTNDDSLRRMHYLASQRIVKHWHAKYQNWDMLLSQRELMFADRPLPLAYPGGQGGIHAASGAHSYLSAGTGC